MEDVDLKNHLKVLKMRHILENGADWRAYVPPDLKKEANFIFPMITEYTKMLNGLRMKDKTET